MYKMVKPKRKEYPVAFRESVVDALRKGRSQAQTARDFNISRQLVSLWNRKYKINLHVENKPRSGRPRKTTAKQDRLIIRKSKADPKLTSMAIHTDLKENHGIQVHVSTVKRRLAEAGLHGRRPSKKPLISAKNRKARLAFARKHKDWTQQQWSKVLWSDESKYNLFSSDGIKYVRRPKNQRNNVRYQVPTVKHGGGNVMVWGCFSSNGTGPLVRVNGIMDRFVYKDILDKNMLPYARKNMPKKWIFQQDNDPKHKSKLLQDYFASKKVTVLEWPSQSPDLNPIEHLWEELDRQIRVKKYTNEAELFTALQVAWDKIPMSRISKLIASMPRRCKAVIESKGYATKY